MNKKLDIESGVVMGHPYEIAELSQQYANENLEALANALFETRGVLAPHGDELEPQASEANVDAGVELSVRPGFAVVENGIIQVQSTKSIVLDRERFQNEGTVRLRNESAWGDSLFTADGSAYLSLLYKETRDTPVEIVPYGSGEVELRVVPSYELTLTNNVPDIQDGVAVGEITASSLPDPSVTDIRTDHAARLRADKTLLYDMIDPELVEDVEQLFSRENFVEDIEALFDEKKLSGERVVTRLKEAVEPFFVRTRYEPSARRTLRNLNTIDAGLDLRPDPSWNAEVEWNLYGVRASKTSSNTAEVYSGFDLTQINYQDYDLPLYLRYDGSLYSIAEIQDAQTVRVEGDLSGGPSTDPNAAVTNGADEFQITAEPGIKWFRKNKRAKDFSVDDTLREPVGQLNLEPGFWNVIIQSKSQNSRATKTVGVEVPDLLSPKSPGKIEVSGEQREPATGSDEDPIPANPFNEVTVDQNGEPKINQEDLDRYIDRVRSELTRIQEKEVVLSVEITPDARNRKETKRSMTIGYNIMVEMLTGEGWQTERETTVYRSTSELMRELTWIDLMSDRYRGSVNTKSDLSNLSHNMGRLDVRTDSDRPIRENEIVYVSSDSDAPENNGYWRYEPKMRDDQASGLTDESGNPIRTFAYGANEGYWVQVDINKGSFQGQTMNVSLTGVKGGTDYRVTVQSLGEDGQNGKEVTKNTDELRQKYNAELGFDLHRAINDIYSGYQEMMDTIDPGTFNEYMDNRLQEIRKIIDQASLYGTPPKVTGPFDVPPQPGVTRFSGRNLGSVQKVFMRYAPPGRTDEDQVVEEANFKVLVGQGDPQVAIKNLPNRSQLSKKASPVITLEFNAGARGSDFFAVRYEEKQPSIVGPNVLSFKENRVEDIIKGTTYGNTASYWRYDSRVGEAGEPTPYGPLPKRWPTSESWDAQSGIFNEEWEAKSDEALSGYGPDAGFNLKENPSGAQRPTKVTETVRALQFRAKRMVPSDVLDIRIRRLPNEKLVPQLAYEEADRFAKKVGDPYYYALRYSNNGVEIMVPERATSLWSDQSFALEYAYYPSSLVGGSLNDAKGVFIENRGRSETNPANPSKGDYYYNTAEDQAKIYDDNGSGSLTWQNSERVEFRRHTFSVQRDARSQSQIDRVEGRFIVTTDDPANESDLSAASFEIGYHTAPDAGRAQVPFARQLVNDAALELEAPLTVTGDSGTDYIFDEWRERATTFSKNRSSLPDNTAALDGERRASAFGVPSVRAQTPVDGTSVRDIIYIGKYREARDFSGSGEGVITVERYEENESGAKRAIVSHSGTEYLVDHSGTINASTGTDLEATGIILSGEQEWAPGTSYLVLRTISVGEVTAENIEVSGPSQVQLIPNRGETITLTVNKDPLDNYNVGWVGTSLTDTSVTTSGNGSETTISVSVDWENLFGNTVIELQELRPQDDIGRTEYEGPLYREREVFDFRSPSLRIRNLRLRVSATKNNVSDTKHVSVQLTPYYDYLER